MIMFIDLPDNAAWARLFADWQARYSRVFLLTDTTTAELCLPRLQALYGAQMANIEILPPLKEGEAYKDIQSAEQIWQALLQARADRHALLLNLGGGLLGDVGGWAAANYMRGIDFVQMPTTLLSQVDAAVGGKTAINFGGIKNLIGAFAQPQSVVLCPQWLQTLPSRQIAAGFAEMLKHSLLDGCEHWQTLRTHQPSELPHSEWIRQSVDIKSRITQADPTEQGLRKILNLGHTIGHAIEAHSHHHATVASEALLHGEAVAAGLWYECRLAARIGLLAPTTADDICQHLQKHYHIPRYTRHEDIDQLLHILSADKKNRQQSLRFALLADIGKAQYDVAVDSATVAEILFTG